jgi:coenzyme Q-binding protein COQ10
MQTFKHSYFSKYPIDDLFQLIIDIEEYPNFLPWCSAARIIDESEHLIIADLIIHFKAFTEHYRSQVELLPPNKKTAEVNVSLISGPFKHLKNNWKLKKVKNGTNIDFFIEFEFKSALLEKLIGLMFYKACKKMVTAFEDRAKFLFELNGPENTKKNRKRTKAS